MKILTNKTYDSMLRAIEQGRKDLKAKEQELEQNKNTSCKIIGERNKTIQDLKAAGQKLNETNDSLKAELKDVKSALEISEAKRKDAEAKSRADAKQLDRNKRYQKEFANQKTEEVKELKNKIKELEQNNAKELKRINAVMGVMATTVEAAINVLATYMRMLPQYKKRSKVEMAKLAQELINSKAKELVDEKKKQAAEKQAAKAENE